MEIQTLEKIEQAPAAGYVLAYLRERVVFRKYQSLAEVTESLKEKELLELHLFDSRKEYRAIHSTSKRFPEGKIETLQDFSPEEAYAVKVAVKKAGDPAKETDYRSVAKQLTVLNHLKYDENGSVFVDNYRLIGEE